MTNSNDLYSFECHILFGEVMKKFRSKKPAGPKAPSRHLIEVSPHRTTGGVDVGEATPYDVEYESAYEKLAIPRFLLCRDVKKIYSQQARSYLDSEGIEHTYTADFLVEHGDTETLIEIKSLRFLMHPDHLPRHLDIAKHFRVINQRFAFIVDAQLFFEPHKANTNLLMRYLTASLPTEVLERVTSAFGSTSTMSVADLCQAAQCSLGVVYTLIAQRRICFDWSNKLNKLCLVSLPDQPFRGLRLEDVLRSTRHGDSLAALGLGHRTPDQYGLEDAASRRRTCSPLAPWNFVGGFSRAAPLRDLREEELRARKSWDRRDRAPGQAVKSNDA